MSRNKPFWHAVGTVLSDPRLSSLSKTSGFVFFKLCSALSVEVFQELPKHYFHIISTLYDPNSLNCLLPPQGDQGIRKVLI